MQNEEPNNVASGDDEFSKYHKGDRICYGILYVKKLSQFLQLRPTFLSESMDQVIELDWLDNTVLTENEKLRKVRESYLGKGWKVAHLMMYLGGYFAVTDVIKDVMEGKGKNYIYPMKDGLGRPLSAMSHLFSADFPRSKSLSSFAPTVYNRLKAMEFNEQQLCKLLLICCWKRRNEASFVEEDDKRSNENTLVVDGFTNDFYLPLDIVRLTKEFYSNGATWVAVPPSVNANRRR